MIIDLQLHDKVYHVRYGVGKVVGVLDAEWCLVQFRGNVASTRVMIKELVKRK